jgi:hypothetical protein
MSAILTVLTDPHRGRAVSLEPGRMLTVGRSKRANRLYVADRWMAPIHFSVEHRGSEIVIRDLSQNVQKHERCGRQCFLADLRNAPCAAGECAMHDRSGDSGLYVNRERVREGVLRHGDAIVAGRSCIVFTTAEHPLAAAPGSGASDARALTPEAEARALALLAQMTAPLYALVDAARSPEALASLLVHEEIYYSLYDGPEGEKLEEVAPYLVELPEGSPLLATLVRDHWGKSMFSLLAAPVDFKVLRRHLRHFLLIENEQKRRMYFRFYDPRVLRAFLPTCTPEEAKAFFGPIQSFLVEGEGKATAWHFTRKYNDTLRKELLQL